MSTTFAPRCHYCAVALQKMADTQVMKLGRETIVRCRDYDVCAARCSRAREAKAREMETVEVEEKS